MPTNYQESVIAGTTWIRSYKVDINNPYGGVPSVVFHEQRAIALTEGEVVTVAVSPGFIEVGFDPSATIPLVNPWTGEPITNVDNVQQYASHIEAYILLHSLYLQSAQARDVAANAEPPPADPLYGNPDPPPEEPPP